jgi:hypothetical protein
MIFIAHLDGIGVWRSRRARGGNKLELALINSSHRKRHRGGIALGRFFRPCARITNPTPDGIALWKISRSQTPPGRNCSLEDLSLTNPTRMELHFGRSLAHKPHPDGIALWKIFRPWVRVTNPARVELRFGRFFTLAKITNPAWVELDLEDFSPLQTPPGWNCTLEDFPPLGENYKPRRGGIALWRIFRPNLNPAGVELHLEDFSPLGENQKPRRGGIAPGRFFALARESNTPPGWNCSWKIFRTSVIITNPAGAELHLEDFSPLGEDYKPHPGGIGLGRFFALTNPTRMELHFGGFFAQTPPVWNWTWKIFRPNPTRMEFVLWKIFRPNAAGVGFFALGQESQTLPG